tara:strand:- start:308 stop:499 length:192 start_codon:yes stop_codon:yes gene_type:complete
MSYTRQTYQKRVLKAGFTGASWARHCGVKRDTIQKQFSGAINDIKRVYWIALDATDKQGTPDT